MYWYKYMESQYATQLVDQGKLRINSLSYYKNIESLGNAVGDVGENTLTAFSDVHDAKPFEQLNELEKQVLGLKPGAKIPKYWAVENLGLAITTRGRPSYALCFSVELSAELLIKMNEELKLAGNPPYTACVKIIDHVDFKDVLSKYLKKENLNYYGHGSCTYTSRRIPWDEWDRKTDVCPGFIKDPSHAWQNEVRILFETPSHEDLEPIDCEIPDLKSLCEIIEIPKHIEST